MFFAINKKPEPTVPKDDVDHCYAINIMDQFARSRFYKGLLYVARSRFSRDFRQMHIIAFD